MVVEIKEGWNKTVEVPKDFLRGSITIAFARRIASVNNVVLGKASSSASSFVPRTDCRSEPFLQRCVCSEYHQYLLTVCFGEANTAARGKCCYL